MSFETSEIEKQYETSDKQFVNKIKRRRYYDKLYVGATKTDKANFKGKYLLHCITCYGKNFKDSKKPILLRKVDEEIWNLYQEAHDVTEYHDIILIHESRLPKYIIKNILGGKNCQRMTL